MKDAFNIPILEFDLFGFFFFFQIQRIIWFQNWIQSLQVSSTTIMHKQCIVFHEHLIDQLIQTKGSNNVVAVVVTFLTESRKERLKNFFPC